MEIIQIIHFSVSMAFLAYLAAKINNIIKTLIYDRKERKIIEVSISENEHRRRHDEGIKEKEWLVLTKHTKLNTEALYLLEEKRKKEKTERLRRIVRQPKRVITNV